LAVTATPFGGPVDSTRRMVAARKGGVMQATGPSAIRREASPISWVSVVLGGLLFIAPWVFG